MGVKARFAAVSLATAALGVATVAATAAPALADYGPGTAYQVEISGNGNNLSFIGGKTNGSGGGLWFWAALTPTSTGSGSVDYEESNCVHNLPEAPTGDSHHAGTASYTITGNMITISGVSSGLGQMTVTVPATFGHSSDAVFGGAGVVFNFTLTNLQVQVAP
jgi:hypothetical protein